jgi:hypothetical protein
MSMANSKMKFTMDLGELRLKSQALYPKLSAGLNALMEYEARNCEADMRSNAPWEDQTGNARNGLFAKRFGSSRGGGERNARGQFLSAGDTFGIVLYHSVPYGIFLETKWSGRYAVILPTVAKHGPSVMSGAQNILRKLS